MKQYYKSMIGALICSVAIYFILCSSTNNYNWNITDYLLLNCLYQLIQINLSRIN